MQPELKTFVCLCGCGKSWKALESSLCLFFSEKHAIDCLGNPLLGKLALEYFRLKVERKEKRPKQRKSFNIPHLSDFEDEP